MFPSISAFPNTHDLRPRQIDDCLAWFGYSWSGKPKIYVESCCCSHKLLQSTQLDFASYMFPSVTSSRFPLKAGLFELKKNRNVWKCLGDHFARVESSGDHNLTMFILHFHVFFHFRPPLKSHENPRFPSPFKTSSPGTMPR